LRKLLAFSKKIPMDDSLERSHLFIVNLISGGGFLGLFSTHPPMEKRIARLESLGVIG